MLFFGEPWDAPALAGMTRVPAPAGQPCGHCTLPFCADDQGFMTAVVVLGEDGKTPVYAPVPFHKECWFRMGAGSVEHLEGRCGCTTGHFATVADDLGLADAGTEMSDALAARIDALATWDWARAHGTRAVLNAGSDDDVAR
jgi:hypothetical protein